MARETKPGALPGNFAQIASATRIQQVIDIQEDPRFWANPAPLVPERDPNHLQCSNQGRREIWGDAWGQLYPISNRYANHVLVRN